MSKKKNSRKKRTKTKKPAEAKAANKSSAKPSAASLPRLLGLIAFAAIAAVGLTYLIAYLRPLNEDPLNPNGNGQEIASEVTNEDDPRQDGWDTEVLSNGAAAQLKKLAKHLTHEKDWTVAAIEILAPTFRGQPLTPPSVDTAYSDQGLTVSRMKNSETPLLPLEAWLSASAPLADAFLAAPGKSQYEVKIFRIEAEQESFETDARVQLSALQPGQANQMQAVWRCRWSIDKSGDQHRLTQLTLVEYEQIHNRGARPLFVDCTPAAMVGNSAYASQLIPGYEEWFRRTPKMFDRKLWGEHGMALGDVNGDDLDDVYLCEPGSLPNRLFVHQRDGTVKDASAAAGVDWYDQTRSALFLDLDNDGDQDLVVAITGRILLMENDGSGKFSIRVETTAAPAAHAMAAADFDLDGFVDIYACSYYQEDAGAEEYQVPIPYNDAANGGRNILFRNLGDWRFEDVTAATGLDAANDRWSLAASWEDFDNDGDVDLYVANDFGRNCLYQNNNGRFENVAAKAGVEDVGSGMSVAWGDYNGDGLMDIYVSNMFSTAGGRITNQKQFQATATAEEKARFRRMAKGNTLFANRGDGQFRDVSEDAAVARARWAWGAPFVDINNDGREDLFVANGFLTREDTHDL